MLTDLLPAATRKALYVVYAFVGLVLGATQAGFAAAEAGQPVALTVALAVYAFLGTGLGLVASANTPPKSTDSGAL